MIVILDYNSEKSESLISLFQNLKVDYCFSMAETIVSNADKLIFPEILNLSKTYRKLQLSNIFNLLKIYNKPIVSLGNSYSLMVNNILDANKRGLGYYNLDNNFSGQNPENNFIEISFIIEKATNLLRDVTQTGKIEIDLNNITMRTPYTSCWAELNGKRISVISENKNYSSIHFDILRNKNIAKKIIRSFSCL